MSAAEAFGAEVQRRRKQLRMSRRELARRTGLSGSGIVNIETGVGASGDERRWSEPKRESVIDIAVALGWDPDEALQWVGRPPLDDGEKQQLADAQAPEGLRVEMDELWAELSGPQRQALVRLAATMVNPWARSTDSSDVMMCRVTVDGQTTDTGGR